MEENKLSKFFVRVIHRILANSESFYAYSEVIQNDVIRQITIGAYQIFKFIRLALVGLCYLLSRYFIDLIGIFYCLGVVFGYFPESTLILGLFVTYEMFTFTQMLGRSYEMKRGGK